jgi:glucokinase
MITIGTGVGGGIVLGGRIYRGATGGAGELGHTLVGLDLSGSSVPAPTGFPQPGSLEYVAAGHALDRLVAETAAADPESALGRLKAEGKPVLGPDAVQAAEDGDATAQRIIEIWAERVGIGIANAINTFDPEEVVIGGGAARAGEQLLETAKRVALGYVVPGLGRRTGIRLAWHGVHAGVLGAALLAAHEIAAVAGGVGDTWGSRQSSKAIGSELVMSKRVIECNICGEPLSAATDEELLRQVQAHHESEHGAESLLHEGEARELIAREAYEAGDA